MNHLFSAGLSANPKIKQLYEEHRSLYRNVHVNTSLLNDLIVTTQLLKLGESLWLSYILIK